MSDTPQETLVQIEQRGRLWIISATHLTNPTIDTWVAAVHHYIETYAPAPERYMIYDTRAIDNLSLTPYLRQKATELSDTDRHATGRIAIVVSAPSLIRHVFDMFGTLLSRRIQPKLAVRFFAKLEEAVKWVEAAMNVGDTTI